jgi:enterochelin esterase-like enzyme
LISLTSNLTLALSATITVALFALLNIKWNKLNRIWKRIAAQVLLQVMLLATVGLALNNQNGFYSSWSELFGISSYANQHIAPKTIDLSRAKYTKNGSAIIKEVFTGHDSKITEQVWFLIPKHIVTAIQDGSSEKFPAAVFLSGSPGVPTAWLHGLNLDDQIVEAKKSVKLKDFVAILPQYNVVPHSDTGCMNIPNSAQVEDWLTKDVYNYAVNNLPLQSSNWAITGYSTGGWCSAMLALRHPEIFKAAAPIAGYFNAEFPFKIDKNIRMELRKKYDLVNIAKAAKKPTDIFLITSTDDPNSYGATMWFHNQLGNNHNVELLTVPAGGHNFSTWRPLVQDVLKWFAGEFR